MTTCCLTPACATSIPTASSRVASCSGTFSSMRPHPLRPGCRWSSCAEIVTRGVAGRRLMCAAAVTNMNRRIVLARRPQGAPVPEDFRLETQPVPNAGTGEVLLRTRYLSLDPYMRGRMNEGPSYAPPVALGAAMTGQTVRVVEASGTPTFQVGELVLANVGWQDYAVS